MRIYCVVLIIINGSVRGSVVPLRGLRQGDPLLPYLFIMIADAFSGLIRKASEDKRIHGAGAMGRKLHLFCI